MFIAAVDCESPEMLEELLELAYDTKLDDIKIPTPFLTCTPLPNSKVLALACKKNNYALIRLMVDRDYRLKPCKMGASGKDKDTRLGNVMMNGIMKLAFQRVESKEDECFEASDQIQNLRVMELAVNPSYILACYTSLADKYDWSKAISCECSKEHTMFSKGISDRSSTGIYYLSQKAYDEDFHFCPTHNKFAPNALCDQHLECNDPVTRCFILAKTCSDYADEDATYRAEYRELATQCKKLATAILDSCAGLNEVRILLKQKAGAQKFFKWVEHYKYPQLELAVEHKHKEFVSHAYCQQVIEKDYVDNMKWKERSILCKLLFILGTALIGVLTGIPYYFVRAPRMFCQNFYGSSEVLMYKGERKA